MFEKVAVKAPSRCVLVCGIDANGDVKLCLPYAGNMGVTSTKRTKYSKNGSRLMTLVRNAQLKSVGTSGKRNAKCWTWVHPTGSQHRIDHILTRLRGDRARGRKVDYTSPVNVKGVRGT